MPETLAKRLRNRDAQIDAAVERAQTGTPAEKVAAKKKKKKKKKPVAKVGTGQSSFNLDAAIAKIKAKQAMSTDPEFKARLQQRIEALKANAE